MFSIIYYIQFVSKTSKFTFIVAWTKNSPLHWRPPDSLLRLPHLLREDSIIQPDNRPGFTGHQTRPYYLQINRFASHEKLSHYQWPSESRLGQHYVRELKTHLSQRSQISLRVINVCWPTLRSMEIRIDSDTKEYTSLELLLVSLVQPCIVLPPTRDTLHVSSVKILP